MPDPKSSKRQLRRELRQRRQTLGADEQLTAAQGIIRAVTDLPGWASARHIALYLAADGEIDTKPLSELCRELDRDLFLPVIEADDSLSFAAWQPGAALVPNRYGIAEPPAHSERCLIAALDIIFMPLVGWDRNGGRLGMGGGFYDRTLSGVQRPLLVGLSHALQEVDRVPGEDWDVPLDFIATDIALHKVVA